jgi:hypothetical protein
MSWALNATYADKSATSQKEYELVLSASSPTIATIFLDPLHPCNNAI